MERLWRLEGHKVPPRKTKSSGQKAIGDASNSAWALPAVRPNHVWSYDFVAVRLANGGPLRILNVVDEYTRECVGSLVARSIGARHVTRFLERVFLERGEPAMIRSDNGREFIAEHVKTWLAEQGVLAVFIEKASPQQNCYVERFNGSMRDELLNGEHFHSLLEARVVVAEFVDKYNNRRPHRGLGMKTPAAFAKTAAKRLDDEQVRAGGESAYQHKKWTSPLPTPAGLPVS